MWEYFTVRLVGQNWGDSNGNRGTLRLMKLPERGDWYDPTPLFNEFGRAGWELVSVGTVGEPWGDWFNATNTYTFKRKVVS